MKKLIVLIMALAILASCAIDPPLAEDQDTQYNNQISVIFINVGRADSILLKINDKTYLIDTGEKQSVPALFRALSLMKTDKIDGLFLTHTHSDHIGGTESLAQKYQIEALYSAEISQNNKNGENKIVKLAQDLGLKHTKLNAGDIVEVENGIAFQVIAPIEYNNADDNDNSLVLIIELNGKKFLFTGDMQFAEEDSVLKSKTDISADVLKVGNHGNPDATSSSFAKAVAPKYAVITTNTTVDTDSANKAVISNLNPAKILITQDYICGIKMDVDNNENINVGDLEPMQKTASMEIVNINSTEQIITIKNNGQKTDISGYFILSERGSEVFVFPEGSMIDEGQTISIACIGGTGNYIWQEKNVWNKKKSDIGILYDCYGNELSKR